MTNVNALLLYPEFPDGFWSFKHALKFIGRKAALPPLGLLTIAAMMPKEWHLRLVDTNVRTLTDADLWWADYVFISAMVVQRESAKELIARCVAAGIPVIAGGPLFTEESEGFPEVDHLVLGEAEEIFPRFLADLEAECAKRVYQASGYSDIQTAPVPRWDLLDLKQYASMAVQFSRGCPYDCEFCDITVLYGRRPRVKTPEQVLAELDALWDAGWHRGSIFFVDDNFVGNRPYLKRTFLPALIAWQRAHQHAVSFYTEVTVNLADDVGLVGQMVSAGFKRVFVGIETPEEEGLRECGKLQNTGYPLIESVKKLQRAGLEVQAGFILGFDSDTPSTFERQRDFIERSGIATAMVGILQAMPATRLYKRLQAEGRIKGMMASGSNVDGTTNIIPKMAPEILSAGYRNLVRSIYAPKEYYRRVRTFLREYNPAGRTRSFDLQGILAFGRSVLYLGIVSKERFQYWKLIVWMLLRRPRLFAVGIESAIYGYHFRKVYENI